MKNTDDLAPALFEILLFDIAVLAAGIATLLWWHRRFRPSTATISAVWMAFIWSYFNLLGLPFVPGNLVSTVVFTAVSRGVVLIAVTWVVVRLIHWKRSN